MAAGGRFDDIPNIRISQRKANASAIFASTSSSSSASRKKNLVSHEERIVSDKPLLSYSEQIFFVPAPVDGDIEWMSPPFSSPPMRVDRAAYYTKFKRISSGEEFSLLDHVLVARVRDSDTEEVFDFFVGQIEAMWQVRQFMHLYTQASALTPFGRTKDLESGERNVRVAWFFWPEEVTSTQALPDEIGKGVEVLTSGETDVEPVSRVVTKTSILCAQEFHARGLDAKARYEETSILPVEKPLEAPPQKAPEPEALAPGTPAPRPDLKLLTCYRCGMWGFRNPSELGAHTGRYCGDETPETLQVSAFGYWLVERKEANAIFSSLLGAEIAKRQGCGGR